LLCVRMFKQNEQLINTYLVPLLIGAILLIISFLIGLSNFQSVFLAGLLFVVIGISIFLSEILLTKTTRINERKDHYSFLSNLLFRHYAAGSCQLLTLGEMVALEAAAEEVWIYAHDLRWEQDNNVIEIVIKNFQRGAKYRYLVPKDPSVLIRVDALLSQYAKIRNVDNLVIFRTRGSDSKMLRFGVVIYNPSVLGSNPRGHDECVVVFIPHYSPLTSNSREIGPYFSIRGSATAEIQECFIELWRDASSVPRAIPDTDRQENFDSPSSP
jgi:hypothetical protein